MSDSGPQPTGIAGRPLAGPMRRVVEIEEQRHSRTIEFDRPAAGVAPSPGAPAERTPKPGEKLRFEVSGAQYVALPWMPEVSFPTDGARVVETEFSPSGAPVCTEFLTESGGLVERISYVCDDSSRVVEAVCYAGEELPLLRELRWLAAVNPGAPTRHEEQAEPNLLERVYVGCEYVRLGFVYDDVDRLIGKTDAILGMPPEREAWGYNERGEVSWHEDSRGVRSEFQYEYDDYGNWIRQVVVSGTSRVNLERRIEYWE